MKCYVCKNCGYDVGGALEGYCPECNIDLSTIICSECSHAEPKRAYIANDKKCTKCGAVNHIPSGPFGNIVRIDSGRPVTLSASSGVLDVWPTLMYFTGISFIISANLLLFMTYGLNIKSETTYWTTMILSSLGVIGLNIFIFGGLVASLAKDIFYYSNQKLVFIAIYLSSFGMLGLTWWVFIALKIGGERILPVMLVLLVSLIGSAIFSFWLGARSNDRREALQSQALVKKSVMDLYTGTYDETTGVNTLIFQVIHDELCVGLTDSKRLSKTIALDHNKFQLPESNAFTFTFVNEDGYDLIAGDEEVTRYYQKVSS